MSQLFRRIFLLLAILFGAIAFLVSAYSSWNLYDYMSTEYQDRGLSIGKRLANQISPRSPETLSPLLKQFSQQRGVSYIVVRNSNGQIIGHTFSYAIPVEINTSEIHTTINVRHRTIRDYGMTYETIVPIKSGGSISVGMDRKWITHIAIRSFLTQQFLVFLAFIVTVFVSSRIIRRISKPLMRLTRYANTLSQSTFATSSLLQPKIIEIAHKNRDEVGLLASAIIKLENQLIRYIRNLKETTSVKEKIESELSIAREIQMNMVPRQFPLFPNHPELTIHAYIEPAKAVGGDFYDFVLVDDQLIFFIGDVSGKGIPAALFMAMSTTLIGATALASPSPGNLVQSVNQKLCIENKSRLFVTLFYGVLNLKTGQLQYAVGGHNPPYIISANDYRSVPCTPGYPLGIDNDATYITHSTHLNPNDIIFVYTDGVTESRNKAGDFFGESGLEAQFNVSSTDTPTRLCERVLLNVAQFSSGAPQSDDLTMFAIQWQGHPTPLLDYRI